ncbi:MAG TPA: glutamine--fructose-6-phosphate transaminase (isomerizing) [Spirochaetia bacterium]|nr:glutamine--fructose-6-phosphate transaminase (isomerizing) [Spirochaetia bacterium]
MCGIVGYVGPRKAAEVLLQGLKMLEYRGYDSSGISYLWRNQIRTFKKEGKIINLEASLPEVQPARCGIAHTRWATHGRVNDTNAHPHVSANGKVSIVHNGIIDNYHALKNELQAEGYVFKSETDSEVIAHLVEHYLESNPAGGPEEAVRKTLSRLVGTYGLLVLFTDFPDFLIGAKNGSPLVVGQGDGEIFLASDPAAFIGSTRNAAFLEDREMVIVHKNEWVTKTLQNEVVAREAEALSWSAESASMGEFPHYFIKEIFEQPEALRRALGQGGRLLPDFGNAKLGGLNLESRDLLDVKQVVFLAMGSALYAAQVGAYLLETVARIPARAEDASEFRYRNPIVDKDTLYFAVSQSGETADTIQALQEVQQRGGRVLGIINAVGSTMARLCKGGVYIHAGPEISVTSSKAFLGQMAVMNLLTLLLGRMRILSLARGREFIDHLLALPALLDIVLQQSPQIHNIARKYIDHKNFLFMGRGILYPIALEGALKLKEISYVHAEGFSAGGLKHGPLALVGPGTPCFFLVVEGESFDKVLGNLQEVKARQGRIIAVTNSDDPRVGQLADDVIKVPLTEELLSPFTTLLPLQLFAYYTAVELGVDVDRPRNLAKSVTTE